MRGEPFTADDRALALAAANDVPVPVLYSFAVQVGVLRMLMEDLGQPVREAEDADGVAAAIQLHPVPPQQRLLLTLGAALWW